MEDCGSFRIYVGGQLPDVVRFIQVEMRRKGMTVYGDEQQGRFAVKLPVGGSIDGQFEVSGQSIVIEILQRPRALSCARIESKMHDLVLDAKAAVKNQQR